MDKAKPASTPLGNHFRLCKDQSSKTDKEIEHMSKVPYALIIGSLMYAMVCTSPNITHAVGVVSRYMSNPSKTHWKSVKWVMRYWRGTSDTYLCFPARDLKLEGFVDADLIGDIDSKKRTTYFVFTLGGTVISWGSNL